MAQKPPGLLGGGGLSGLFALSGFSSSDDEAEPEVVETTKPATGPKQPPPPPAPVVVAPPAPKMPPPPPAPLETQEPVPDVPKPGFVVSPKLEPALVEPPAAVEVPALPPVPQQAPLPDAEVPDAAKPDASVKQPPPPPARPPAAPVVAADGAASPVEPLKPPSVPLPPPDDADSPAVQSSTSVPPPPPVQLPAVPVEVPADQLASAKKAVAPPSTLAPSRKAAISTGSIMKFSSRARSNTMNMLNSSGDGGSQVGSGSGPHATANATATPTGSANPGANRGTALPARERELMFREEQQRKQLQALEAELATLLAVKAKRLADEQKRHGVGAVASSGDEDRQATGLGKMKRQVDQRRGGVGASGGAAGEDDKQAAARAKRQGEEAAKRAAAAAAAEEARKQAELKRQAEEQKRQAEEARAKAAAEEARRQAEARRLAEDSKRQLIAEISDIKQAIRAKEAEAAADADARSQMFRKLEGALLAIAVHQNALFADAQRAYHEHLTAMEEIMITRQSLEAALKQAQRLASFERKASGALAKTVGVMSSPRAVRVWRSSHVQLEASPGVHTGASEYAEQLLREAHDKDEEILRLEQELAGYRGTPAHS